MAKKEKTSDKTERIEEEMLNIRSLTDVLITVNPCELERNTIPCLAAMILNSVRRMESFLKERKFEGART